jgi:hypothetical protein
MGLRLRKLLLFVLLGWLPLQASALPVLALWCHSHPHESAMHSHEQHHDHDADVAHSDDGSSPERSADHGCCQNYFSGLPAMRLADPEAPRTEPARSSAFSPHLFFPEQPQRPPRSARL